MNDFVFNVEWLLINYEKIVKKTSLWTEHRSWAVSFLISVPITLLQGTHKRPLTRVLSAWLCLGNLPRCCGDFKAKQLNRASKLPEPASFSEASSSSSSPLKYKKKSSTSTEFVCAVRTKKQDDKPKHINCFQVVVLFWWPQLFQRLCQQNNTFFCFCPLRSPHWPREAGDVRVGTSQSFRFALCFDIGDL